MDTFALDAGTALEINVQLADDLNQPITSYDETTPLEAEFWPGGERPASFLVDAAWLDAPAGRVRLLVAADQTIGLASGRYRGRLVLIDPDRGPVVGYEFAVDLKAAPGTAPEPPTYCSYVDLLDYGRSWLPTLQGDDDEAGFAEYRGRARQWLDDLILSRAPRGSNWNVPGTASYRPFAALLGGNRDAPSPYLRSLLDGDLLFRRGWVIEATAKKALSLICRAQVGPGEGGDDFRELGASYAADATILAMAAVAEIASPPVVVNDEAGPPGFAAYPMLTIHLGSGSLR